MSGVNPKKKRRSGRLMGNKKDLGARKRKVRFHLNRASALPRLWAQPDRKTWVVNGAATQHKHLKIWTIG